MRQVTIFKFFCSAGILGTALLFSACGSPAATNTNIVDSTPVTPMTTATATPDTGSVGARVPEEYQAKVTVRVESTGSNRPVSLPTMTADVAKSGNDRRMEFMMPAGGRIVYLDKARTNYLVLPERGEYARVDERSTGFDIRRMMTPEQIVERVKGIQGVERVGDETYNGRAATRYRYGAVAATGTRAGEVETQSSLIVDKETGLPLLFESASQASNNVQGYTGVRIITELSDIKTEAPDNLFDEPTNLKEIEPEQVRAQVDMVFRALAGFLQQMMQAAPNSADPDTAPAASPTR